TRWPRDWSSDVCSSDLACWTAGLSVAPVNSKLHAKEVAWIVEKTRAKLLFTSPSLAHSLASTTAELLVVDGERYRGLLAGDELSDRKSVVEGRRGAVRG